MGEEVGDVEKALLVLEDRVLAGESELPKADVAAEGVTGANRRTVEPLNLEPEKCMDGACEVYKIAEIIGDLCVLT